MSAPLAPSPGRVPNVAQVPELVPTLPPPPSAAFALAALTQGIAMSFRDPGLRRLVGTSFLANAIGFILLVVGLVWGVFAATAGLTASGGFWTVAGWTFRVGLILGLIVFAPALFALLLQLLRPVFNGRLYVRGRVLAGAAPPADGGLAHEARAAGQELRRIARSGALWLAIAPVAFVPGIGGPLFVLGNLWLGAHVLGWDLLSYHFETHKVPYEAQKAWVDEHRTFVLALGAGASVLALVPLLGLVFLTTNVVAAGILSAQLDARRS